MDDIVVYRLGPSHFMLVVNAANVAKDHAWITDQLKTMHDVAVVDTSSRYALIALQGPAAVETLRPIRARLEHLRTDPGEIDRILSTGSARAAAIAAPTLEGAYEALGLSR